MASRDLKHDLLDLMPTMHKGCLVIFEKYVYRQL